MSKKQHAKKDISEKIKQLVITNKIVTKRNTSKDQERLFDSETKKIKDSVNNTLDAEQQQCSEEYEQDGKGDE